MDGNKNVGLTLDENSREEEASGEVAKSNCWLHSSGILFSFFFFGWLQETWAHRPTSSEEDSTTEQPVSGSPSGRPTEMTNTMCDDARPAELFPPSTPRR